mmetsp:Transcript_86905/g.281439  ORF Transcript_86905/g.281439 Transcript_86905/m.281439 type:complete len:266 (+) Transcript_86905:970-1767(+)
MRSPVLRCTKLKSSLSLEHCVPLPLPGPPTTKTTWGGVLKSAPRNASVSSETSTSMTCFLLAGGGSSTAKAMPSSLTPYSTKRLVRSGGAKGLAPAAGAALGLFSRSQRLSHFTAARPLGCTWQRARSPRERSCCSVGSTAASALSASKLLRSMDAPADLRKRKSRTSSSSGTGSAPSSGKKKRTSRAALLAEALPCRPFLWPSQPQRARSEPGRCCRASFTASGPMSCCHTATASRRQSTMTQEGPAQAASTRAAKWGRSALSR